MIYGNKFLNYNVVNEAKEIISEKFMIMQSTAKTLQSSIKSSNIKCDIKEQINTGGFSTISNNSFLKGKGRTYTYYVVTKNIDDAKNIIQYILDNQDKITKKIESDTKIKIIKFKPGRLFTESSDKRSYYSTIKITYEIFGYAKNGASPIDEVTKDAIEDAAEASAKKINSKYLSRVKSIMKNPNHDPYTKEEINETNFSDISVQFGWDDSFDIEFNSISQDVYFDIEEDGLWKDIADILKNDINKVITNPDFKIKLYNIGDDCAVISMVFKL